MGGGGAGRRGAPEIGTEDVLLVTCELSEMFEVDVTDEHSDSDRLVVSVNCGFGGKAGPLAAPTWDAQMLSTVLTRSLFGGSGGGRRAGTAVLFLRALSNAATLDAYDGGLSLDEADEGDGAAGLGTYAPVFSCVTVASVAATNALFSGARYGGGGGAGTDSESNAFLPT